MARRNKPSNSSKQADHKDRHQQCDCDPERNARQSAQLLGHRLAHEVAIPCQAFTWLLHQPTPSTPGELTAARLAPSGQLLPDPPEDQSQKRDRHPLTYDDDRQGAVVVVHAHSPSWSWRSRHLDAVCRRRKRRDCWLGSNDGGVRLRRVHRSKEASSLGAFPFCSTPRIKLMSYWIIGTMVEAIIR